ncbi:MAG: carboxylating nicotinate-nucleotide diphosphorylase [Vicinamibacterales bacterium]
MKRVPFEPLDPGQFRDLVRRALAEDIGWGDVTTNELVPGDAMARGVVVAKAPCTVAGLDVAAEAFRQLDPAVVLTVHRADGAACAAGEAVATVTGRATALITAERVALNFLQRLSGVATLTRAFVDAAAGRITVLDTRKTTPLLRALEKYAVRAGGGVNHRFRLDDAILIKDNHLRLGGGVMATVTAMRTRRRDLVTEVEVDTLAQLDEALAAGAELVLLDNMTTADIIEAVRRCDGRVRTEISGNVTLARMPELAATGADYVSVGALTHSAPAIDLSFELELL